MTRVRSFWLLGGFFLPLLAAALPYTQTAETPLRSVDAASLRPGVVVDSEGHSAYIMNPEGGIDALLASSGETLWTTRLAAKPLALHQDLLFAQGLPTGADGVLEVVLFDAGDGEWRQSLSLQLPAGVVVAVDEGMSTVFTARVEVSRDVPYLLWDHLRRYAKGIAPQPGEELGQLQVGAFRLDLLAGRAVAVDPTTLQLAATLPPAIQQWVGRGEVSTAPAMTGEVYAATRVVDGRLVLKRWDLSGQSLVDVELFAGPYLLEQRSADGRHLIVSERDAPGEWREYGWSVFSLDTGERLGQVRSHRSQAWFRVDGARLIHLQPTYGRRVGDGLIEEPRQVRAVRLDSGLMIWRRPLRDPSFRGAFPP